MKEHGVKDANNSINSVDDDSGSDDDDDHSKMEDLYDFIIKEFGSTVVVSETVETAAESVVVDPHEVDVRVMVLENYYYKDSVNDHRNTISTNATNANKDVDGSSESRDLQNCIAKEVVSAVVSKAIEIAESMDMTHEVEHCQGVVRQKVEDDSMMTRPFMPTSSISSSSLTVSAHNNNGATIPS